MTEDQEVSHPNGATHRESYGHSPLCYVTEEFLDAVALVDDAGSWSEGPDYRLLPNLEATGWTLSALHELRNTWVQLLKEAHSDSRMVYEVDLRNGIASTVVTLVTSLVIAAEEKGTPLSEGLPFLGRLLSLWMNALMFEALDVVEWDEAERLTQAFENVGMAEDVRWVTATVLDGLPSDEEEA